LRSHGTPREFLKPCADHRYKSVRAWLAFSTNTLLQFDPAISQDTGVCTLDSGDWTLVGSVSPGQLISFFPRGGTGGSASAPP
jgi:hypothetical protein